MVNGERLAARMKALGFSQSLLARRIGVSQAAIHKLVNGTSRSSGSLHLIARELQTTPAYLTGETDDADENAPPPPPQPEHRLTMMAVAWPNEQTLAAALRPLLAISRDMDEAELALELARQLPSVVATAQSARPSRTPAIVDAGPEHPEAPDVGSPQTGLGRRN